MDLPFDSPPSQVLSRLADGDTGKCIYLLTCSEEAGLKLVACEDNRTWTALLTTANISTMARQAEIDSEDFKRETERALRGQPGATENFVYSVTHKSEELQLTWKRHLLPENVKFQLGSVLLREEEAGTSLRLILEHAVSTSQCLQDEIAQLQRQNQQLAQEQKVALERLEQVVHNKEQMEKELYSKFKLVLNEKKNKIRRLMDALGTSIAATPLDAASEQERVGEGPAPSSPGHPSTPSTHSALLGEPDEVVSPPKKRRKRETRHQGAKEPNIPKPPTIFCPQTNERRKESHSSSADGDDLLRLL